MKTQHDGCCYVTNFSCMKSSSLYAFEIHLCYETLLLLWNMWPCKFTLISFKLFFKSYFIFTYKKKYLQKLYVLTEAFDCLNLNLKTFEMLKNNNNNNNNKRGWSKSISSCSVSDFSSIKWVNVENVLGWRIQLHILLWTVMYLLNYFNFSNSVLENVQTLHIFLETFIYFRRYIASLIQQTFSIFIQVFMRLQGHFLVNTSRQLVNPVGVIIIPFYLCL